MRHPPVRRDLPFSTCEGRERAGHASSLMHQLDERRLLRVGTSKRCEIAPGRALIDAQFVAESLGTFAVDDAENRLLQSIPLGTINRWTAQNPLRGDGVEVA